MNTRTYMYLKFLRTTGDSMFKRKKKKGGITLKPLNKHKIKL